METEVLVNKIYNTGETEQELKNKYNYEGSVLRKAQTRMTEMLVFLDKICQENKITYFICMGTLLGAVRHGGFIPWDDDIDVYVYHKDMKRLRDIINSGDYQFVVQNHSNDKGFVRYYNVLRDLKSEYIKDEFQHNQRKYRGIQIDLFPIEYGVLESGKKLVSKTIGFNERYLLGKHPLLSETVFIISYYGIIPSLKCISSLKGKKHICLGYEGFSPGYKYYSKDVFPLQRINFEGFNVPCPNNVDAILKVDFGDGYENLPPEKSRNHHNVIDIRFFE